MDKLKQRLQDLRSPCTTIYDTSIESLNMLCEEGIAEIENAPAANQWIPCRESLPEDGEEVLCYSSDWGAVVTYRDRFDLLHATHWMPLPSPPEVRQNDT